ncbi:MAG: LL-diaminopimelate aminotransferase [Chlamydiae bacterium]|nr:LL-diaminopimelate aminotransferase [Chlamydiota bacterium]
MVERNADVAKMGRNYLFHEIAKRKKALLEKEPGTRLINLGIGDTTEPIPPSVVEAMREAASRLGSKKTYTGYGETHGKWLLREKISEVIYNSKVSPDEIFISDGAKCDVGRMQLLFSRNVPVALQDPVYPAYMGASVLSGKTGGAQDGGSYEGIHYLPCTPENGFTPDVTTLPPGTLLYLCSPNNPTGTVLTRDQLTRLVHFARENRCFLLFDSAYAAFIQSEELPRSIYEIEGAQEVAIETSSFSKRIGFTGVRLGWSVVPHKLTFADGSSVWKDWSTLTSTLFNEASNIAQAGGIAALEKEGLASQRKLIAFYLENARLLREALSPLPCYGGEHAPFLWLPLRSKSSWETFETLLEKAKIVTTPGVGFGPSGEGFIRISAFASRSDIHKASTLLQHILLQKADVEVFKNREQQRT